MANKKISELVEALTIGGEDLFPVVDTIVGETKKVTTSNVAASVAELLGGTSTSIPMAVAASTELDTYVVLGAYVLNPDNFNSVNFVTVASVTGIGLTGLIQLWNVTDVSEVIVNTYSGLTSPSTISTPVTLPSGDKIYEVRHKVLDGASTSDRINTSWAGFVGTSKPQILV